MVNKSPVEFTVGDGTHHFTRGHVYVWTNSGMRRVAGWFGIWWRTKAALHQLIRKFQPRMVCSAIDHESGVITMSQERWSWRRWRWERR